jgi:hypothetical protein
MSTKHWSDLEAVDFIEVKRPIEYDGLSMEEVVAVRESSAFPPMAFLWSSNNSITVDADFWRRVELHVDDPDYNSQRSRHARHVFSRAAQCAYGDGTGEPGFINEDQLVKNDAGLDAAVFRSGDFVGSDRYSVQDETRLYLARLARITAGKSNGYIVNPCGEIVLSVLGAFCVIADVAPFHCDTLEEAHEAVRAATRALMRVNLMDSLYAAEVRRTNRIGVGLTGVHEFAWKFFQVGFRDLIAPDFAGLAQTIDVATASAAIRAAAFWEVLGSLSRAVHTEATEYAEVLGVTVPHTMTTIKPSGSVSKLFGLTEGGTCPRCCVTCAGCNIATTIRWSRIMPAPVTPCASWRSTRAIPSSAFPPRRSSPRSRGSSRIWSPQARPAWRSSSPGCNWARSSGWKGSPRRIGPGAPRRRRPMATRSATR